MLSEGMGISAVAGTLGLPEGTVSYWLHREGKRLGEINEEKLENKRKRERIKGSGFCFF